jgi:hypothetical protein
MIVMFMMTLISMMSLLLMISFSSMMSDDCPAYDTRDIRDAALLWL